MVKIKQKCNRSDIMEQFREIVTDYVDERLLRERAGFKPLLYYNGPRSFNTEYLPEFYALQGIDYKKTSHEIELPEAIKSPYYSCMIYVSPEYFSILSDKLGYSLDVAYRLRKQENYYNIFKLNYYGERRNVDDIPFALIKKGTYSEEELKEALEFFETNHEITGSFIPVVREINGQKCEFLELNFDFSNFYPNFEKLDFDKLKQTVYYNVIRVFSNFNNIILVQSDGRDIALSKAFSKTVRLVQSKSTPTRNENNLLGYVQSKEAELEPLSAHDLAVIEKKSKYADKFVNYAYAGGKKYPETQDYITVDDEQYRTMLYYIYKGAPQKGITIEKYINEKFDSIVSSIPIKTPEGTYKKISIAVNRAEEHEFASQLPLMCDFWRRTGIDRNNSNIFYRNYYGELCNPHSTPFALVQRYYASTEIMELLAELKNRYNFSYMASPIKRPIRGTMQEFSEISVNWFANSDVAKRYLSNFENSIPILNNLDTIARAKSAQYGLDYHPVYANSQLK